MSNTLRGAHVGGGPKVRCIPVRTRSARQQLHQAPPLPRVQLGGPTGREAHPQRLLASCLPGVAPAHHRTRRAIEKARHLVERSALIQKPERPMPARLQHRCGALRSHDEFPPETHHCIIYALGENWQSPTQGSALLLQPYPACGRWCDTGYAAPNPPATGHAPHFLGRLATSLKLARAKAISWRLLSSTR
jgi:hypothetical protein